MTVEEFQQFAGGSGPSSRTMSLEIHGPTWDKRIEERGGMAITPREEFRQALAERVILDFESDEALHETHESFLSVIKSAAVAIPLSYSWELDVEKALRLDAGATSPLDFDLDLAVTAIKRRKRSSPSYEWIALLNPDPHVRVFEWSDGIGISDVALPEALRHVIPSTGEYFVAEITHEVVSRDGFTRSFKHYLAQRRDQEGQEPSILLTSLVSMSPIDRNASELLYGPER
jgi:hypothetical protein